MMSNSILTLISSLSLLRVACGVIGSAMKLETSNEGLITFALLVLAATAVVKVAAPNPNPTNLFDKKIFKKSIITNTCNLTRYLIRIRLFRAWHVFSVDNVRMVRNVTTTV